MLSFTICSPPDILRKLSAIGDQLSALVEEFLELMVFSCHCEAHTPSSLRGAIATKQCLKAIVRLLRGACPERHEILRYAQNDTKRRARNDSSS